MRYSSSRIFCYLWLWSNVGKKIKYFILQVPSRGLHSAPFSRWRPDNRQALASQLPWIWRLPEAALKPEWWLGSLPKRRSDPRLLDNEKSTPGSWHPPDRRQPQKKRIRQNTHDGNDKEDGRRRGGCAYLHSQAECGFSDPVQEPRV